MRTSGEGGIRTPGAARAHTISSRAVSTGLTRLSRLAPCAEEGAHERTRALRLDAAGDRDAMVQARVGVERVQRLDRAALGIGAAVDEPTDPRLDGRADAHRTRLDRDVENRARQPVVPGRAR